MDTSASDPDVIQNHQSNASASDEKEPVAQSIQEPRSAHGIRWGLIVTSILSSTFLFALDNTVVADIQADIVNTFGEVQKLSWLPVALLVVCVSTNLIWYVGVRDS